MSRYFLHLHEQTGSVFDDEGIEVADAAAAIERAAFTLREMVANDILAGLPVRLGSFMVIVDDQGQEVRRLHVRDVVRFIDEPVTQAPPVRQG